MIKLKRILPLLLVAMFAFSSSADAKVGIRNVEGELKTASYVVPNYFTPAHGTDTTAGTNGNLIYVTINAVAVASATGVSPFPARLSIVINDATADSTPSCTTVKISGKNAWGKEVRETITTLNETPQVTKWAYEVATIAASGCTGGDANDFISVIVHDQLGLPLDTKTSADIISICIVDASASNNLVCEAGSGTTIVSTRYDIVDVGALGTAAADDDAIIIRMRPVKGK